MKTTYQLNGIKDIAKEVVHASPSKILLFHGNMGVGKTTLIKEIANELGVDDITSSPTFSLVNEYHSTNAIIYHFDFYRIEDEEEVLDIGIEEYFYNDAWCLIEWPEKIPNLIPEDATHIQITENTDGSRTIEFLN